MGFDGCGTWPKFDGPVNVAPSSSAHFPNVSAPAIAKPALYSELIVATALSCASDRQVSPVSAPFGHRSVFGSKAALHAATLLMIPSFTPSRSSHFAYTASPMSFVFFGLIQAAPPSA